MRPSVERSCSISYMFSFVNTFFKSFLKFFHLFSCFLLLTCLYTYLESKACISDRFLRFSVRFSFFFLYDFFVFSLFSFNFSSNFFEFFPKKQTTEPKFRRLGSQISYKILLQFSGALQIISSSPSSFFFHST